MDIEGLGQGTIELLYHHKKVHNYSDLYELTFEQINGLGMRLDNPDAGLKKDGQLQVSLDKAIFGLSQKGWGNLSKTDSDLIASKIENLEDVINESIGLSEIVDKKKLHKFREILKKEIESIDLSCYSSFKRYCSFNLLIDLKFNNTVEFDLFDVPNLDSIEYIDQASNIVKYADQKNFGDFITKVSDRSLVSIKEISAKNIIKAIEKSKERPFENVLYALGIRDVGEVSAKTLVNHFLSIENIMQADYDSLISIRDIGESVASNILSFFSDDENLKIINKLKDNGLNFEKIKKELNSQDLNGLNFVISGKFSIDRNELKRMIEENGGKNVSSLSKNTSYLIVGENMGPSKKEKAEKENIKMISELEFYKLLKNE